MQDGVEVWNLRQRPTAEDVGIVSGDMKTHRMSREELVKAFASVLEQLDLSTDAVLDFARRAERATGHDRVISDRVAGQYGSLDLGVLARYSPHAESGRVALIGNWLKDD